MSIVSKVKFVVQFGTTIGTAAVVKNLIVATTPPGLKGYARLCVAVGRFIVPFIAADLASTYVGGYFDGFEKIIKAVNSHDDPRSKPA